MKIKILKTLFFALALFSFLFSGGQTVKIVDAKSGQPIEGVIVHVPGFTLQSGTDGKVSLDKIADQDKILFQHASYVQLLTTKQKIARQNYQVFLQENPIRMDEIVVSVNRWEQNRAEVPQSVVTITSEDVLRYNPQTAADMLGSGNGVFIQKSQMGGGSPMIRGFSANRLLIVVDGVRMNNAIYRSGNLQNVISIDPNSLENTEVILGPGTVIYGSDALGGVMSFSTLKPKLSTLKGTISSGKAMTRFSSANFEKTVHSTINLGGEKWAALLSSTFSDFDDQRMGSQVREEYKRPEFVAKDGYDGADHVLPNNNSLIERYTAYSQFTILGKLRFRPSDKLELILSANHSQTSDIPRYDRLIVYQNDRPRYGEWHYGPQVWSLFSSQLILHPKKEWADKINLQTAFQKYAESRYDRAFNNPERNGRKENLSIYSLNLDFAKAFNPQNDIFYGIESYYNLIHSTGTVYNLISGITETIPSRYPDNSEYGSFAAYSSFKHRQSEKLIVQSGLRFTHTWMSGTFKQLDYGFPFDGFNLKNSALIGNLGLVWHPEKEWQINMDLSTGFRSPNIDDVAKVFDSEPGNVIVPNPDLKPEYTRTFDMELKKEFAKKASFEIGAFFTRLKNAVVRRDYTLNGKDSILYDGTMSKVEALVNADAAIIYGGSLALDFVLTPHLSTKHDITFTKGSDSDGYPLRHVPPLFGSSHLIVSKQKWFADLYIHFNGKITYENLAPSEQDKPYMYATDTNGNPYSPAWLTLNIKGNYKLNKYLVLSGGIENILDQGYRPYSSGVVSPGINFIFSAQLKI